MSVSSRHNWRSTFYFHHSNAVNYFNNYKIYCEKNCVGILLCMQSLVGAASFIFLKGSFFFFLPIKKKFGFSSVWLLVVWKLSGPTWHITSSKKAWIHHDRGLVNHDFNMTRCKGIKHELPSFPLSFPLPTKSMEMKWEKKTKKKILLCPSL